jgi:hypothetical protein
MTQNNIFERFELLVDCRNGFLLAFQIASQAGSIFSVASAWENIQTSEEMRSRELGEAFRG